MNRQGTSHEPRATSRERQPPLMPECPVCRKPIPPGSGGLSWVSILWTKLKDNLWLAGIGLVVLALALAAEVLPMRWTDLGLK